MIGKGFLEITLGWIKCHVGEDIISQGFLIRYFSDFGCYSCNMEGVGVECRGRHQTSRMSDSLLAELINEASLVRLGPGSKWLT